MRDRVRSEASGAPAGFATRKPPQFTTPAEERRHRLERLAGTCRLFGRSGFSEGLLGHVTVRDPEHHDLLWANPLGVSLRRMRVSDLVQIDHDGNVLHGSIPVNPVGVRLHAAIHEARPDVVAVCHAHSIHGSAWSAFGRPVAPHTQDTAVFFERQAIITEPRLANNGDEAAAFATAFGDAAVGIQVGHGIFTTGTTIDEAAWNFVSFERACEVQLLIEAASGGAEADQWPQEQARGLAGALGSPGFGWLSFQPLWDDIIASDPDLLD